jgi:hypothetical protein
LTSKEAHHLLLERISTDQEFYKSLKGSDEGGEEDQDDNDNDGDNKTVHYDEIDSSKTINEAIADVIKRAPADCLADIYVDKDDGLSGESDAEDRGTGTNLDMYTGHEFSTRNATGGWMEWNSK